MYKGKEIKGIPRMGKVGSYLTATMALNRFRRVKKFLQKEWPNKYIEWIDCRINLTVFLVALL